MALDLKLKVPVYLISQSGKPLEREIQKEEALCELLRDIVIKVGLVEIVEDEQPDVN